jgi:AraC-like DNA-binding protein
MLDIQAKFAEGVLLEYYEYDPGPPSIGLRHAHEEYQVCISLNFPGEYWYRGTTHAVPVRSVAFLHPGEVHSSRDPIERNVNARYAVMYLPRAHVRDAFHLWLGKTTATDEPFFSEPIVAKDVIFTSFMNAWHVLQSGDLALRNDAALLTALGAAFAMGKPSSPYNSPSRNRTREAVDNARKYLEEHFAENVRLAEIARLTGVSPYHLAREFRTEVGMPLHAYQIQLRVMRAKKLILSGLPISEVSSLVGFYDQSHLGRHFRKLVGVSLGKYVAGR